MNKITITFSLLLAAALGVVALQQSSKSKQLAREAVASRARAEEAGRSAEARNAELAVLQKRIEQLKEENSDLPALRGEITQLRTQNTELKNRLASAERTASAARSQLQSVSQNARSDSGSANEKEISLAQAPIHVRNKIALQYPGAKIGELVQVTEDGRTFYSLNGVAANDREMRAVLDANGEVLEQEMEMRFREVPNVVKGAVARQLNRDGGIDMTQVWEDGQTTYRGNAEQNGQEMHFVFSETGEMIRYETWIGEPEREEVLEAAELFEAGRQ